MYGVVNRKKKKDGSGEHYTDMWYYLCKNTKVEGPTRCTYTKHVRQDELDGQVFAIVKDAFLGTDFTERVRQRIGTRSGIDELNAELDGLQASKKKEERQKAKLAGKIMALDADDPLYDSMYETLQDILREHVASIAELDRKIEEVGIAIHNAAHETAVAEHTLELTKAIAAEMMDVLMEPEQARRIFHLLIESIQIFPEPMPDGLILKSVKFRIPMEYEGDEVWGAEVDMSAYDSLPDGNHDETVVLLSKGEIDSQKVRVEFSLEVMDMSEFKKSATYGEIKAYVLEKHGLKVSSLYIAQIKEKLGIKEQECYNKPKSEGSKVPQCPYKKEVAIMDALQHFGLIRTLM